MANGTVKTSAYSKQAPTKQGFTRITSKRRQGYGQQQIENEKPSDVVDTSTMSPQEKIAYFKSIGIM